MALSSNVPLCAVGDCFAKMSVAPNLGFNREPETMALRDSAPQSKTLRGPAKNRGALS